MNEKINLRVPVNYLKRQFDQLANSNLIKGTELSSKQLMSYVQSIYSQLAILQQILAIEDNDDNEDNVSNESYLDNQNNTNKYDKFNIQNNIIIDDIAINLEFALNNAISLYDDPDVRCINSILKFIDESKTDLLMLKKRILDSNTYSALNNSRLTKIKRK